MVKPNRNFNFINHTADIGILVRGAELKMLFQNAAEALMQIMLQRNDSSPVYTLQNLSIDGTDYADLMVRWLGEILYLFQGERRIVNTTRVQEIAPNRLSAQIQTTEFNPDRHKILYEIKAVTYHQIDVFRSGNRWRARIIFDI